MSTTPSADFCHTIKTPHDAFSHESVTHSRSPVISSTAFHAQPPDLPPVPLMDTGFAISCSLARHRRPHHPVLVHRLACLLHASFRPHLAVTPLRFANPSPPSGWVEDFHLQAVEHARRTTRKARPWGRAFSFLLSISSLSIRWGQSGHARDLYIWNAFIEITPIV